MLRLSMSGLKWELGSVIAVIMQSWVVRVRSVINAGRRLSTKKSIRFASAVRKG